MAKKCYQKTGKKTLKKQQKRNPANKFAREKTIQKFTYEVLRHSKYLKQELIMLNKIYYDSYWPSNNELIKNLEYMETFQHDIENIQRDIILINSENDIFNDMEYLKGLGNKFIQKKIIKRGLLSLII